MGDNDNEPQPDEPLTAAQLAAWNRGETDWRNAGMRRLEHHRHRLRGKPKASKHETTPPEGVVKAKPAKHTRAELRKMAEAAVKAWREKGHDDGTRT